MQATPTETTAPIETAALIEKGAPIETAAPTGATPMQCLTLASIDRIALAELLDRFGLDLTLCAPQEEIPGSYWGEREAGLQGDRLYARLDTPVHSVLHEASHYLCMTPERRVGLDTDAGGDDLEEAAVCYLQILLADELPGLGRERMLADMDAWGYSFRLGSAGAWFERDAEDAREWLVKVGVIDTAGRITGGARGSLRSDCDREAR